RRVLFRSSAVFATAMDWERILLVASHVGTTEHLLETSIAYARTRSQFGQPIGKFQAVAHKIADMKTQLEAARLLTYRSAWRLDHARNASLDASITKLFVSETLLKVALDTIQIHGGYALAVQPGIRPVALHREEVLLAAVEGRVRWRSASLGALAVERSAAVALVEAYRQHGSDCLKEMSGPFAIAVIDMASASAL